MVRLPIIAGFVLGILAILFGLIDSNEAMLITGSIFFGTSTIALVLDSKK